MTGEEWIDAVGLEPGSAVRELSFQLAALSARRPGLLFATNNPPTERAPACWYTAAPGKTLGYYVAVTPLRRGWWRRPVEPPGPVIRIRTGQTRDNKRLSYDFPAEVRALKMRATGSFADEVLSEEIERWQGDGFTIQGEKELLIFVPRFVRRFDLVAEVAPIIDKLDAYVQQLQ